MEQKIVSKPWGHEVIFAATKDYVGKILVIKAGHQLSLQFHKVKEETIYLQSGEMRFQMENEEGEMEEHVLRPGSSFHIAPNRKHRMIAVKDCEVFEVSTPHLDDVVRLEDKYGRTPQPGSVT
ncbi:MAG: cupin domain-containing protein [Bdellovibrionales bacterium]|nr:cupin domain-containing protein [Bdellovibrionales bacterium]